MKKLTKFLCAVSVLLCSTVGVVACGKDSSTPDTSSSEIQSSEEGLNSSLSLSATTLGLDLYESKLLVATASDESKEVVWSSSDSTVVTVSNGTVTGLKVGTATVTASVGDEKATCTVVVSAGTERPIFVNLTEQVGIIKGTKDTLDVSLSYKGQPFTLARIEYSTTGTVLSLTEDGEMTALTYGTQNVTVKAYVGDVLVVEKMVEVSVIEYGSIVVDLQENKLNLAVGEDGYDLDEISVLINGVIVENPEFQVVSNDASIATVRAGKIVGLSRGETVVKVSYISESNKTYDTSILVTVTKNVIVKETAFLARGNAGLTSMQTGNASIDLSTSGIDVSTVTQILCGEQEIVFNAEATTLTLTNAPAGEQIYTLITPTVDYIIEGCIYTNEISTKADFIQWRKNAGTIFAYTILTADIDMQGEVLTNVDNVVNGILDGRGHTISNFILKATSLAIDVSELGGFKNIQFINFVQDCAGITDHMTFGIFAKMMYGTIENVVLKGRVNDVPSDKHHYGVFYYGGNGTSITKNVIADITVTGDETQAYFLFGVNWAVAPALVQNVYAVTNTYNMTYTNVPFKNAEVYLSEETLLSKADFSAWGKSWIVNANQTPYLSDYSTYVNNPFIKINGKACAGESMIFETTSYLPLIYTLQGSVNGVALNDNVLSIDRSVAVGTEIVVNITSSKLQTIEKTLRFVVEVPTVETAYEFLAKGDAGITASNTGNAVLDLSQTTITASSITGVLCNGENITFSANANSLTLTNAPAGENTYTLVSAVENYTVKVCVYGYAISNKAEFIAWRNSAEDIRAYTILTADIDLDGESFNVANRDLSCILDGRGYTIANFTLSKTSLFTNVTWLGGYKNIQFINVTQSWEEADGGWGILAKMMYGSAENILIKGNISGLGSVMHSGVLFYGGNDTANVKNIIAEITTDGTGTYFVAGVNWSVAPNTLDNIHVAIIGQGVTVAMTYGAATATNSGAYTSTADLINATKQFSAPWIVETDKLPYMRDYASYITNGNKNK